MPQAPLQSEEICRLGGLLVIGTERHESRRIDNQLRGRCGRQGDPGSTQFYVSMEDDLMRIFGSDRVRGLMDRLGIPDDMPIENKMVTNSIEKAQVRVEGHNFDTRKHLLEYDDVLNKHREVVYGRRLEVLEAFATKPGELKDRIIDVIEGEVEQVVLFHTGEKPPTVEGGTPDMNGKEILETFATILPLDESQKILIRDKLTRVSGDKLAIAESRNSVIEQMMIFVREQYDQIERAFSDRSMLYQLERDCDRGDRYSLDRSSRGHVGSSSRNWFADMVNAIHSLSINGRDSIYFNRCWPVLIRRSLTVSLNTPNVLLRPKRKNKCVRSWIVLGLR